MIDIITLINPVLLAALGYWIWKLQRRLERREELEDKLREDRMQIYYDVVRPFMTRFKPKTASRWQSGDDSRQEKPDDGKQDDPSRDQEQQMFLASDEYYWSAFRLSLIGSDGVIRAYNDLFQHLYHVKEDGGLRYASLLGTLLLEIRKSMGNEATEIDNWEMLEWLIMEARKLRELDPQTRSSASVGRGRIGFLRRLSSKPPPSRS